MPRSPDSNVAVFIDYENVGCQPHFRARDLLDHLKEHGRLIMKKAYADWSLYVREHRCPLPRSIESLFTSDAVGFDSCV